MVVWTERTTGTSGTGWLPLLMAFLLGVTVTAALHRYTAPLKEAERPPSGRQLAKKRPAPAPTAPIPP